MPSVRPTEARVNYDGNGELDEIATAGVVHLERMDSHGWCLVIQRNDGTVHQIWLRSKKTVRAYMETSQDEQEK